MRTQAQLGLTSTALLFGSCGPEMSIKGPLLRGDRDGPFCNLTSWSNCARLAFHDDGTVGPAAPSSSTAPPTKDLACPAGHSSSLLLESCPWPAPLPFSVATKVQTLHLTSSIHSFSSGWCTPAKQTA